MPARKDHQFRSHVSYLTSVPTPQVAYPELAVDPEGSIGGPSSAHTEACLRTGTTLLEIGFEFQCVVAPYGGIGGRVMLRISESSGAGHYRNATLNLSPGRDRVPVSYQQVLEFTPYDIVLWLDQISFFPHFGPVRGARIRNQFVRSNISGAEIVEKGYNIVWCMHHWDRDPGDALCTIVMSLYMDSGIPVPKRCVEL
ncbi:unnamed protein product [Tuber aestivum]|uniref:Uncharacterized protein n=1 Tax=Tuber aestivum TaxID=59557 RepID=A0A292PM98_9PEZI|nr:unnamed protein product [Tuber aestivum]